MRFLLLPAAVALALWSALNFLRAPDSVLAWKLALAAGEFGHWLVLLALGLAAGAICLRPWGGRSLSLVLSLVAGVGFLRPAVGAWRMSRDLPEKLSTALGARPTAGAVPFDVLRLYWQPREPSMPATTEVFARRDDGPLTLDYYAPMSIRAEPQRAHGPAPRAACVVVIHGGGWDGGDTTQFVEWNHRWAARGYAVAAINYRFAPRHPWPAQRDDVLAAVAWLKANADRLRLDPRRIVLLGRSAGGQIATAVAYGARDPDLRGVIAAYAPHDMKFAWSVSREDDALNSIKLLRQLFGGPPDSPERTALYESASGQLLARAASPPTLLLHGVPDTLAWYRHSRRLEIRLRELGVKHYLVEFPWATHAFDYNADGPAGQLSDYAIAVFLQQVTGP